MTCAIGMGCSSCGVSQQIVIIFFDLIETSMIGQNVDKMKRLLEQSNHGVPEVLFKLYTFVRTISLQLKEDVAEY